MILSRRIALGGVQLDEADERIIIRSIDPGIPEEEVSTVEMIGGAGKRILRKHWETLEARVRFAINVPKRELELRREVFETACDWARNPGWVTVNFMPGRRMYADYVQLPNSGDLWNWTEDFEIRFVAHNVPFWQDETAQQATVNLISSGSVGIENAGDVESVLDVTFVNRSGKTINSVAVGVNGHSITLTDLALGGSETLRIYHGEDGLLRIRAGSRNVYGKYTGSDDLYTAPGPNTVTFEAERAGKLTVACAGRYV